MGGQPSLDGPYFLVYTHLGTVFIRFVDATKYVKDEIYLNKLFNEVIEDVGVDCVVQIITDDDESTKKTRNDAHAVEAQDILVSMCWTLLKHDD